MSTALYRVALTVVRGYRNFDYEIATNGEAWLLKTLSRFKPATVFDVGANHGEWMTTALAALPTATVHAFEVMPATFASLSKTHAKTPRAVLRPFGLSDQAGTVEIRYFPDHDGATSIITDAEIHAIRSEMTMGKVMRGDGYCAENGIEHIDLLKIDVEGAEHKVLAGFDQMLRAGRVDVVQFEYGLKSVVTRYLLKDFYDFFLARGYAVGKLYPNGVAFKDYHVTDEDFMGPNYIAVLKSRADIRNAIAR